MSLGVLGIAVAILAAVYAAYPVITVFIAQAVGGETGVRHIIASLEQNSTSHRIQVWSVMTLRQMLSANREAALLAVAQDGVRVVGDVMQRWHASSSLHKHSCGAVVDMLALANVSKVGTSRSATKGIISAMKFHIDDVSVQQPCAVAIAFLCRLGDKPTASIRKARGLNTILLSMQHHPQDVEIQHAGCAIVGSLVENHNRSKNHTREAGGIVLVISAMKNHPDVTRIQTECVTALAHLAINNPDNVHIMRENDGVESAVAALSNHSMDQSTRTAACAAIRFMASSGITLGRISQNLDKHTFDALCPWPRQRKELEEEEEEEEEQE